MCVYSVYLAAPQPMSTLPGTFAAHAPAASHSKSTAKPAAIRAPHAREQDAQGAQGGEEDEVAVVDARVVSEVVMQVISCVCVCVCVRVCECV